MVQFEIGEIATFITAPNRYPHCKQGQFNNKRVVITGANMEENHYNVQLVDDPDCKTDCYYFRLKKIPQKEVKITLTRKRS